MLISGPQRKRRPGRKPTGQIGPDCPRCGHIMGPNGTNYRKQKQWRCPDCHCEVKEPSLGSPKRNRKTARPAGVVPALTSE